ncbi:MAG: hypothetical protein Q8R04_00150 [Nanoarchaeota archaeon]|nr:hypothetical protein [Nanoarchaeota archaeon]
MLSKSYLLVFLGIIVSLVVIAILWYAKLSQDQMPNCTSNEISLKTDNGKIICVAFNASKICQWQSSGKLYSSGAQCVATSSEACKTLFMCNNGNWISTGECVNEANITC